MDIILKILSLAAVFVFIIDISGIVSSIERKVTIWLTHDDPRGMKEQGWHLPKPFSCSMCMTWWGGIIMLFVLHSFNLYGLLLVAFSSFITPRIADIYYAIDNVLTYIINSKWKEKKQY
jgi:hypothetical protein